MAKEKPEPRRSAAMATAERFVICPASEYLHPGMALRVYRSSQKGKPMARCSCRANVFLPPVQWTEGMGLTMDRVRVLQLELGQRGLLKHETPGEGDRFVLCPTGGFVHTGGHAVRVTWSTVKKSPVTVAHALCECGTHVWFGSAGAPSRWTERMGMTVDEVVAKGFTISG